MEKQKRSSTNIGLPILLIGVGVIWWFASQMSWTSIDWGDLWPAFVIVPGLILAVRGWLATHRANTRTIYAGFVVTTVGLILAYQNVTNHWESWAYIWALIPASVGFAMLVDGFKHNDNAFIRRGRSIATASVAMFVVFAVFFEGLIFRDILSIDFSTMNSIAPIILIGAGAIILFRNRGEKRKR